MNEKSIGKFRVYILLGLVLLLSLTACERRVERPPAQSTQDAIYTAVAETIQAQLAPVSGEPAQEAPTLVVEITVEPPTATPPPPTPTEAAAATEAAPAPPEGTEAATPAQPEATLEAAEPVSERAAFAALNTCGGISTAVFRVENSSGGVFESVRIAVEDSSAGGRLLGVAASSRPFIASGDACPPGQSRLEAGQTAYVAAPVAPQAPSGHTAAALIELCSQDQMEGDCVRELVEFEIP